MKARSRTEESLLSLYLKEINRYRLLSREEEARLIRRALAGDSKAKEKLMQANLRFVVTVARRYRNRDIPLLDLISEGNIGLLKALEHFDVDRGCHFISYAAWWVRQSILKALSEDSRVIRLPWNRANELVHIERKRREMLCKGSGAATVEKIAGELGLETGHVANLLALARQPLSLDTPVKGSADCSQLLDFIPDPNRKSPEQSVVSRSLRENIRDLLKTLTIQEAEVLTLRFGLDGSRRLSLREIGRRYNRSRERIRQIEKKAIKKLRAPSRRQLLESYVA
jgi:RNA polymerase primary sigma factor